MKLPSLLSIRSLFIRKSRATDTPTESSAMRRRPLLNKEEDKESAALRLQQQQWLQTQEGQSQLQRQLSINNSLLACIVIVIGLGILRLTASFSIPIVLGLLLFMMLFPQAERLHKHSRIPYALCCIVVLLLFYLLAGLLLMMISTASFGSLLQSLPAYQNKLQSLVDMLLRQLDQYGIDLSRFVDWSLISKGLSSAGSLLGAVSASISGLLSSSLAIFLILLFLMLEGPSFFHTITRCFPEKRQSILAVYQSCVEQIGSYLLLKSVISLLTGGLIGSGLWLLGVDFPLVWAVLAFVLNFIPSIGSIIHTLLVSLFALLQFSHNLYFALVVPVFLLSVQSVIGNFLEPRIQGGRLRLSPVFILLFLYVWAYIWGIIGMLLSVPILSVIKIICQNVPQLHVLARFLENARPGSKYGAQTELSDGTQREEHSETHTREEWR